MAPGDEGGSVVKKPDGRHRPRTVSSVVEDAVDQLQENEKLIAGESPSIFWETLKVQF